MRRSKPIFDADGNFQKEKNELGVSASDFRYKTRRCCYCFTPVQMTEETLEIMVKERVDAEKERLPGASISRITIEKWRDEINQYEKGCSLAYEQFIHQRCLRKIAAEEDDEEADEVMWQIQRHNRERIVVPDYLIDDKKNEYDIYSSMQAPRAVHWICLYCDEAINSLRPGFSYKLRTLTTSLPVNHLHYDCYQRIRERRVNANEREKEVLHENIARQTENESSGIVILRREENNVELPPVEKEIVEEEEEQEENAQAIAIPSTETAPTTEDITRAAEMAQQEKERKQSVIDGRNRETLKTLKERALITREQYESFKSRAESLSAKRKKKAKKPTQAEKEHYNSELETFKEESKEELKEALNTLLAMDTGSNTSLKQEATSLSQEIGALRKSIQRLSSLS